MCRYMQIYFTRRVLKRLILTNTRLIANNNARFSRCFSGRRTQSCTSVLMKRFFPQPAGFWFFILPLHACIGKVVVLRFPLLRLFFRTKPPDQKSKRRAKTEIKNKENTTISCTFYTPLAHHPEAVVKLRKLFFHLCSSLRVFCIKLFHALPNHRRHLYHHHLKPAAIPPHYRCCDFRPEFHHVLDDAVEQQQYSRKKK